MSLVDQDCQMSGCASDNHQKGPEASRLGVNQQENKNNEVETRHDRLRLGRHPVAHVLPIQINANLFGHAFGRRWKLESIRPVFIAKC